MLYTNTLIIAGIKIHAFTNFNIDPKPIIIPPGSNLLEIDKTLVENFDKIENIYKRAFLSSGTYEEEIQGCKVFLYNEVLILVAKNDIGNIIALPSNVEV
jgi:hypothetical protein